MSDPVPDEVRELERTVLDNCWREEPAFELSDADLAVGFLGAASRAIRADFESVATTGAFRMHDHQRRWLGALRWGLRWCMMPDRTRSRRSCTALDFEQALALAADYEDVADFFKSCGAGLTEARILHGGAVVEFAYRADTAGMDVFGSYYDSGRFRIAPGPPTDWKAMNRAHGILVRDGFGAAVGSTVIRQLARRTDLGDATELPESWKLGGYTIGEARTAWACVLIVAHVSLLTDIDGVGVIHVSQNGLADAVQCHFAGGLNAAREWLTDLSLNPEKNATLSPLIPISNGFIASTGHLCLFNHERNLTRVVAKSKRAVWDGIKNQKERLFQDELIALFESLGWRADRGFSYSRSGRIAGDVDLAVVDASGSLACLELKWPIPADEIHEVRRDILEMTKGQKQVRSALSWASQHWGDLRSGRNLCAEYAPDCLFGAVVSRTTAPDQSSRHHDVPVVLFGHIRDVLRRGRPKSLREMFAELRTLEGPFEGREDVEETTTDVRLGGVIWRLPSATGSYSPTDAFPGVGLPGVGA